MQKFRKRAVARATIPAAAAASFVNPTKLRNVKKDGKRSSEKVLEKTKIYFSPPPPKRGIHTAILCTAQGYAAATASSVECYKNGKK